MTLEGKDEALRALDAFVDTDWEETCAAFEEIGMGVIMPECVEECPVDQGILQQSIPAVSHVEKSPEECVVIIGAGGAASAYALPQHEHLEYHHTKGKAKYIENPVMRNAPNVPAMVAARKGSR